MSLFDFSDEQLRAQLDGDFSSQAASRPLLAYAELNRRQSQRTERWAKRVTIGNTVLAAVAAAAAVVALFVR